MALMNLYSDPYRTPDSAMNIAAAAQLLSSIVGGVEDWKRRKMDTERYESDREYHVRGRFWLGTRWSLFGNANCRMQHCSRLNYNSA